MTAIDKFRELEQGILKIIKAADIYALYLIENIKGRRPNDEIIKSIMFDNKVSSLNLFGWAYESTAMTTLKNDIHLKHIGQQILLLTYTALESYLINKFKEYYKYLIDNDSPLIEKTLNRLPFRSLGEIKKHYNNLLNIHIASFELNNYYSDDKSNFHPSDSWSALRMISESRNQIAHTGDSSDYKVITLMDSWYPFDFVRRWVTSFDINFDLLIYENRETPSIKDYIKRVKKQK